MSSRPAAHVTPANCSVLSRRLDEPLAGTAPVACAWLAIEQPGPWGARALTQSHLDAGVGAELGRRAEGSGVRIALIRRVGHHALAGERRRRVLLCDTRPGTGAVRSLEVSDARELLDLDLAALGVEPDRPFQMQDLLAGGHYLWHGGRNFVQLDPHVVPAHVFRLRQHVRTEHDFDYFM
jgi:hypothetical protein